MAGAGGGTCTVCYMVPPRPWGSAFFFFEAPVTPKGLVSCLVGAALPNQLDTGPLTAPGTGSVGLLWGFLGTKGVLRPQGLASSPGRSEAAKAGLLSSSSFFFRCSSLFA